MLRRRRGRRRRRRRRRHGSRQLDRLRGGGRRPRPPPPRPPYLLGGDRQRRGGGGGGPFDFEQVTGRDVRRHSHEDHLARGKRDPTPWPGFAPAGIESSRSAVRRRNRAGRLGACMTRQCSCTAAGVRPVPRRAAIVSLLAVAPNSSTSCRRQDSRGGPRGLRRRRRRLLLLLLLLPLLLLRHAACHEAPAAWTPPPRSVAPSSLFLCGSLRCAWLLSAGVLLLCAAPPSSRCIRRRRVKPFRATTRAFGSYGWLTTAPVRAAGVRVSSSCGDGCCRISFQCASQPLACGRFRALGDRRPEGSKDCRFLLATSSSPAGGATPPRRSTGSSAGRAVVGVSCQRCCTAAGVRPVPGAQQSSATRITAPNSLASCWRGHPRRSTSVGAGAKSPPHRQCARQS